LLLVAQEAVVQGQQLPQEVVAVQADLEHQQGHQAVVHQQNLLLQLRLAPHTQLRLVRGEQAA